MKFIYTETQLLANLSAGNASLILLILDLTFQYIAISKNIIGLLSVVGVNLSYSF